MMIRRWNTLQNVDRDIRILAGYLVGLVRADTQASTVRCAKQRIQGAPTITSAAGGAG